MSYILGGCAETNQYISASDTFVPKIQIHKYFRTFYVKDTAIKLGTKYPQVTWLPSYSEAVMFLFKTSPDGSQYFYISFLLCQIYYTYIGNTSFTNHTFMTP